MGFLTSIKAVGLLLGVVAIVGLIYAGYRFFEDQIEKRVAAAQLAGAQATAKAVQDATITAIQKNQADIIAKQIETQQAITDLSTRYDANNSVVTDLVTKLSRHNLENLADEKPTQTEAAINRGSFNAIRVLGEATKRRSDRNSAGTSKAAPVPPAAPAAAPTQ